MPSHFPALSLKRMSETIDVSAALDNCFFHSLALYWLATEQALPEEWFAHQINDDTMLTRLKNTIKNENDLNRFSQYERLVNPYGCSECLMEKVFILGVFLRSYFCNELAHDMVNKADLFSGQRVINFQTVTDFFMGGYTNLEDPLYQANDYFFQGHGDIKPSLESIHTFWQEEGYDNYCRYLANPGVKIAYYEVKPVLDKMQIPYCFYDNEGQVLASSADEHEPLFELMLNPLEGHYKLLKNPALNPRILTAYTKELKHYHTQRALLLEQSCSNKIQTSVYYPSLLVAATLPKDLLNEQSPLSILADRVAFMNAVLANPAQNNGFMLNALPFPTPSSSEQWDEDMYEALRIRVGLEPLDEGPMLNEFEAVFQQHLEKLKEKVTRFYTISQNRKENHTGKYYQAGQEVLWLYVKLTHAFNAYLISDKEEAAFWAFQTSCHDAIRQEKYFGTLEQHRGAKLLLGNIGLAIAGVGIFYAIATCVNWYINGNFLFFNRTDTGETIENIQGSFVALAPTAKVG